MASTPSAQANGHKVNDSIGEIIKAATDHDILSLEKCIDQYSFPECKAVDVQDPATGLTPLHAAIASCKLQPHDDSGVKQPSEESGIQVVKFLLENGAIWNQLDLNDETPGCVAYRLGLHQLYQIMVDAGVRAEMILNRLEEYEELEDEEEDDDGHGNEVNKGDSPTAKAEAPPPSTSQGDVTSPRYLSSTLSLSNGRLLDAERNGVMMDWEASIMRQSAGAILPRPGLKILNIGFGMGIFDSHIQDHVNRPASHHIIEAHPDVINEMRSKGWMDRPNVVIHSGKWQNILPQLAAEHEIFDAIYFDTFAESYSAFRDFFSEHVISVLSQDGRWSFFNGMGADRQISYDVYQKVVEFDLFGAGYDVTWADLQLPNLDEEWEGVRRRYWNVAQYRLPVCRFLD
ncbi:Arginine N-methyltransferase 2 [Cladophialophora carrionii]|uniref:Arginine N-methyltransferase 2 n=1 Tax=Cladophialophora carrionii TaxID=86049 RepID=A0A1C1CYE5_9EURO|nr:Arginine N-methyltransferase 2 [Cladophialophora carrionii]